MMVYKYVVVGPNLQQTFKINKAVTKYNNLKLGVCVKGVPQLSKNHHIKKKDHKCSVKIGKKRRRRWRPAWLDFMFDLLEKEN